MGTEQADSVRKSGDNLDLSTHRQRAGREADGRPIRGYEVAAEMGVTPTAISSFENGKRDDLPRNQDRMDYLDAVARIAARRRKAAASDGAA